MDQTDRKLLNIVQTTFPSAAGRTTVLGERLGISGEEALERVRALAASGVIRRIGPSFDSRSLAM